MTLYEDDDVITFSNGTRFRYGSTRQSAAEKKARQRDKMRAWLIEQTPVKTTDALVMKLMTMSEKDQKTLRKLLKG